MSIGSRGAAAQGGYALPQDEVHVWRIGLDWQPQDVGKLKQVLAPDEREKADRFYFEIDHRRHVVGRGVARLLLGRCLGVDAHEVQFEYSALGKPRLAAGGAAAPLQFNVSHSGDLVLVALTLGRTVGVDVERMRPDMEHEQIAAHFFSPAECAALMALNPGLRCDGFFTCWTRKEAYIKATGDGLSLPLDQFEVSIVPGEPARLLATRPDPAEAARWTLRDLDVGSAYKAAVAVEGSGWRLKVWDWPEGCCSFGAENAENAPLLHRA